MSAWKRSTTWSLTIRDYPFAWIQVTTCNEGSWHWTVTLVDSETPIEGRSCVNLTAARREAMEAYRAAAERLRAARGEA